MKQTFILKIDTNNKVWRGNLRAQLYQLANDINGSIEIYEINDEGEKKLIKLFLVIFPVRIFFKGSGELIGKCYVF